MAKNKNMAEAVGNDPTQVLSRPWISNPEPYPISHASICVMEESGGVEPLRVTVPPDFRSGRGPSHGTFHV